MSGKEKEDLHLEEASYHAPSADAGWVDARLLALSAGSLEAWVCNLNIQRFRDILVATTDADQRAIVSRLISEHEARLRRLVASNGLFGREEETIAGTDHRSSKTEPNKQVEGLDASDRLSPAADGLSGRESRILCLLARGMTMHTVSQLLEISVRTVAYHKYRFMDKHDLSTTKQMVAFMNSAGTGTCPPPSAG